MRKQIMACLISTVLPTAGAEWGLLKILPLPNAQIGELNPNFKILFCGNPHSLRILKNCKNNSARFGEKEIRKFGEIFFFGVRGNLVLHKI